MQFISLNLVINSILDRFLTPWRRNLWSFILKCFIVHRRNRLQPCSRVNFGIQFSKSSNILCRTFAAGVAKGLATLYYTFILY